MATPEQLQTLLSFRDAAVAADHIWPAFAACEAVLESSWGTSELMRLGNNVFGQKQHAPPTPPLFGTMSLPTREYLKDEWVEQQGAWVVFPNIAASFVERMAILRSLSVFYVDYRLALAAQSGQEYVISVSRKWSTDPQRADKVMEIYSAHAEALASSEQ